MELVKINPRTYKKLKQRIDWGKSHNDEWPMFKGKKGQFLDYLSENYHQIVENHYPITEFMLKSGFDVNQIYPVIEALNINSWEVLRYYPYLGDLEPIPKGFSKKLKKSNLLAVTNREN